jgi:hypothetical protein
VSFLQRVRHGSVRTWVSAAALAGGALLVACYPEASEGTDGYNLTGTTVEKQDPLEGAYVKQGGRPVHFVFKRGETADDDDTFLGDIEDDNDKVTRVSGKIVVSRDNLGTKFTLTPTSGAKPSTRPSTTAARDGGGAPATGGDGGTPDQPEDSRPLAEQAFSGTMHYLKIGKNKTILVRGDATGKTAHYRKVKTWCSEDADCAPDVQNTGLDCDAPTCTSKHTCACN